MKPTDLVCVAMASVVAFASSGGCHSDSLVVVDNDGSSNGTTNDVNGNGDDAAANDASADDGSSVDANLSDASAFDGSTGDANDGSAGDSGGGVCVANGITFQLNIGTTNDVFLGGSTPPWPIASLGCPSWLTISTVQQTSWGTTDPVSINLLKDGCGILCPASQPQAPTSQSFTWDGTYYPYTNGPCDTPACAPAGEYLVTMCVGYADPDSGAPDGTPTCQMFSFTWPPATASEALVQTTITPVLGGQ